MPAPAALDFTLGTAAAVQLTSEPALPGEARRRGPGLAAQTTNVLRMTVQDASGAKHAFVFRNTTVAVRDGQSVAIVRARRAGRRKPIDLMLINQTTGQRDEFPDGLRLAASQKGLRARWKALIGAVVLGALAGVISFYVTLGGTQVWPASAIGLVVGVAAFLGLWGLIALIDQITLPGKERAEVQRLRAEVNARLFSDAGVRTDAPPSRPMSSGAMNQKFVG